MDPKNDKQVAVLKNELTDDRGHTVHGKSEMELPSTAAGGLAKVYIAIGLVGTLVVGFLGMMTAAQINASRTQAVAMEALKLQIQSQERQIERVHEAARAERKEMVDRYLASRETAEKRHADVLVKLDKIVMFIDRLVDAMWKKAAPSERPPAPKMLEKT